VSDYKLAAEPRTEFGKGAARRLRRADKIPAVLYGHGAEPVHIALPGHATMLALKHSNALISLELPTGTQLALPKDVQRDPVRNIIEHVDLVMVRRGEKVTVEVPLHVIGDENRPDRVVNMDQQTISLEVLATNIPAAIEIDVTSLEIGDSIAAQDLNLPEGAVFPGEPDDLILSISAAKTQEQIDAELDAAVAGDEDAEATDESAAAEDATESE
jgi:large subunit ribosomal protein L25